MSTERLKLLTTALRSGEYTQSKDTLRNDAGFCCLGVACDIYMKETGLGAWSEPALYSSIGAREFRVITENMNFGSASILPQPVADWYGIQSAGDYEYDKHVAMLNDRGAPFSQIADIIDVKAGDMIARPWYKATHNSNI